MREVRETREVRGCCPHDCQDTCAWIATVEDGRVVRVRGDKDHPFTRGALCAKVNDYQTRTYAPDRLLYPLRRTGPKGSGEFERVSWDEALDAIAARLRATAEEWGGEAILPHRYIGSLGVIQMNALLRLFHGLGASQQTGSICGGLLWEGLAEIGMDAAYDPEEIAEAELIVVWGANPLSTAHHIWRFIAEARKRRGARVVVIDPRRTRTARQADLHLPIRVGGDVALALAMGHVILGEGLEDRAFLAEHATGLDAYRETVAAWTPERAETVCGLGADTIRSLAREFATARPAAVKLGVNVGANSGGSTLVQAVSALTMLPGHWRLEGGGLHAETGPRLDLKRAAGTHLAASETRGLPMGKLGGSLTDPGLDPPVKALVVWGTNPAVVLPDATRVRRGLAREDLFTVVVEHFLTDTATYADFVLPSTTQLEHFDVVGSWGHHYVSVNLPAVEPRGESRNHGWIGRELGRRLGLSVDEDEAIVREILPEGLTLEALKESGWWKDTQVKRLGRVRLDFEVVLPPGPSATWPLTLLSPKSHYTLNSTFVNMDRHRRAEGRPTLEIHPDDAHGRGIGDGARVRVFNEQGEIRAWASVTDDVRPGLLSLPGRWWFERDGGPPAVANVLTPHRFAGQAQTPVYNECFVEVGLAPDLTTETSSHEY
jgi:anaerobic selenocysteine-containing dehydrogenase